MESKDDISDTDSGIILQAGPDSPMPPLKDLTQAVRKQQQELEARLEACLTELRKLCLREAELTGMLPPEYPLKRGDKLPKVRRRIGTAFRLDEKTIISREVDPLSTLERDLALQLQIAAAAQRLYREENISKHIKKRRKNMVLKEEKKLKELENTLKECRLMAAREPRPCATAPGELSALDDSSLSDASLLEEEETQAPNHRAARELTVPAQPGTPCGSPALPARAVPPQQHEGLSPTHCQVLPLERAPIQNSPWKETSLDKPYEKPRKHSAEPCSVPSSPDMTPVPAPARSPAARRTAEAPSYHFVPIRSVALWRQAGSSGPPTPEMQAKRGQSHSMRVDLSRDRAEPRGRSVLPRRRPTYYTVTVPDYCFPPAKPSLISNPIYHSSSEDSNSDVSSISYAPSPGSSSPDISFLRPVPPPCMEQPSTVFRGQRSEGHKAAYYYQTPQKLLLPPSPSYFPAVEYVAESRLGAGREFCRGRPSLLVDSPVPFPYEQDAAQLRYQWLVPAHSRIVRTPSLKDYAPASCRALSKSAVSEELKSWHERTKLWNLRPHSLDRQGAFRVRATPGRELYTSYCAGQRAQVPKTHILTRPAEGAPVQVYVPENSEIITQV
ncbi:innate immunity activator protein [Emydura macquarii macquarii]|uniref:innate immunity activator protein n=1 Tax=Emydura macquarii macquarii TaxID=1129001 RepID=UPI00352BC9E0